MSVLIAVVLHALLCSVWLFERASCQQYALSVLTNPSECYGGENCGTQPSVAVIYRATGEIAYAYEGSIYVQLGSSPTGYEKLYYGSACDMLSCGLEVTGTVASAPIVSGVAKFSNLHLKQAGKGYVLKFIGRTNGVDFASVLSASFDVLVGSQYKLFFTNTTGNAFGGTPFADNPVVAVVDRGENVVTSVNSGSMTVSLATSPSGQERLLPANKLTVPIVKGTSTFSGLYINEAGFPYQLQVDCAQCGLPSITSNLFHVAVGEVAQLEIVPETEPANQTILAGEFFLRPPTVRLLDAGGNHVDRDNSSAILLEFQDNPYHADLGPRNALFFVKAYRGIVQFRQMMIDRIGEGYTLRFTHQIYSRDTNGYTPSDVFVLSRPFAVRLGPSRRLVLRTSASEAWAGQQGFWQQPVLWITDYGNNLVTTDMTTMVTVSLVESLSTQAQILIDTSDAPPSQFQSISTNWVLNQTYGAGEVLQVSLVCLYHLTVLSPQEGVGPTLTLNISNHLTGSQNASAVIVGEATQTRSLTFEYIVQEGDALDPSILLLSSDALALNGTRIVDGNNQSIVTSLADADGFSELTYAINTSLPRVVSLDCNTTSGEYGAGQVIRFTMRFDQPVVVWGQPYLSLAVNNTGDTFVPAAANYSTTSSDGLEVSFDYLVAEGHSTWDVLSFASPSILYPSLVVNTTYADVINLTANGSLQGYRYFYQENDTGDVWIRRQATFPTTNVNASLPLDLLQSLYTDYALKIDTSRPHLDETFGVQSLNASGMYYPGDHLHLLLRFNKLIVWEGVSLRLRVDSGPENPHGSAWIHRMLDDEKTLEFIYVVRERDNTSRLNIIGTWNALQLVSNVSTIRRKATFPTTNVDLDITYVYANGLSLRDTVNLTLAGSPLQVASIGVQSPSGSLTLYPDDVFTVEVEFSGPVVATCSPVLVLDLPYYREATYLSGNQTSTFLFQYTVLVGDNSTDIRVRASPSALCPTRRCPLRTRCALLANATEPTQAIALKLPGVTKGIASLSIGSHTLMPTPPSRETTISNVTFLDAPGEYGVGSVLRIQVSFTDIVVLAGTVKPRLKLSINQYADYAGGNYDSSLIFRYITTPDDELLSGDLAVALWNTSGSILLCESPSCLLSNQAMQTVNITTNLSLVATASSGITLDPTPPNVTTVYFATDAGKETYTAGDLLRLVVVASKPVIVGGLLPRIQLHLPPYHPYAVYSPELSTDTDLVFTYRSRLGDDTTVLSYNGTSLDMRDGYAVILRASNIPTTEMDVDLPLPVATSVPSQSITVDAVSVPTVTNVTCRNQTTGLRYAVGDRLVMEVTFSLEVVAAGWIRLALNGGDHVTYADYAGYVPTNCSDCSIDWVAVDYLTASAPTTRLLFQYVVADGDRNEALEYIDVVSLQTMTTTNGDPSSIRRVEHAVAIEADLTLPLPGETGSISHGGRKIDVDGRPAYLTSLTFLTPSGEYSVNTSILLAMNFSRPVVVLHADGDAASPGPSLLLETGAIKNEAWYRSGSGTTQLVFEYIPEPGDSTEYLDYLTSRWELNQPDPMALRYHGAEILTLSQTPVQPAWIRLNPLAGQLRGEQSVSVEQGFAVFQDVYITRKGASYELRYEAQVDDQDHMLVTTQEVYNSFSSEFQLRPQAARHEESIGHAVALQGDLAVLGAPNFNLSVTTIQVIEVSAAAGDPQPEVQAIQTSINPQPAIQTFHTSAQVDAQVDGYYRISYGKYGPTQRIPANADASTLATILKYDLPVLGDLQVSVTPFVYCACRNAFTWTITFLDYTVGSMDLITVDGGDLRGNHVALSEVTMIQAPSLLAGTFRLSALGQTTAPIAYDAGVLQVAAAIESLGLPVHAVTVSPTQVSRARTWSVTFDAYLDSYEIPLMEVNSEGLAGGPNPSVTVQTMQPGRHSPEGIAGYFQLTFRENTTTPLWPNATAEEVRAALEALPSINTVTVDRTLLRSSVGAYSWTVNLLSVNYHNSRGYFEEPKLSNLEPLVAVNHLIATDVDIIVDAKWELGAPNSISSRARQGTYGNGSGAVFVYQRQNDTWLEVATVRGNDTEEANRFGNSVAVDSSGVLLIGSIGASRRGVPEKQALTCYAQDGYFTIHFRGWTSGLISCNASQSDLIDAIVAPSSSFNKLHGVTALTVDDWGTGGLCSHNRTAILTFYSPVDGAPQLFGETSDTSFSDIELLEVVNVNLTLFDPAENITLQVEEYQKGTWRVHGAGSDPQQIGAAYIFRQHHTCENSSLFCPQNDWRQEAEFFPPVQYQGSEYGHAVALEDSVAVVTAPGTNGDAGAVYIYRYSSSAWSQVQVLRDPDLLGRNRFGQAVALSGDTIAVATINRQTQTGQVVVFIRTSALGGFIAFQVLTDQSTGGSAFGRAVAVVGNMLVIGAPYANGTTHYLGTPDDTSQRTQSGEVTVYERSGPLAEFRPMQVLSPSNVRAFDHFGTAIATDAASRNLIISSMEDVLEGSAAALQRPNHPVVCVTTSATYNRIPLGGTFQLSWLDRDPALVTPDSSRRIRDPGLPRIPPKVFTTRAIPYNVRAAMLKAILEQDLPIGQVSVTRSRVDEYDGGYAWTITFQRLSEPLFGLTADGSGLTGSQAKISLAIVNPSPSPSKHTVHYFERRAQVLGGFIEQAFLQPFKPQALDQCGRSLSLSGRYALVGCPNRDQDVSPRNSGVGFLYDLGLLSTSLGYDFSQPEVTTVQEGEVASIALSRDEVNGPMYLHMNTDVDFYFQTLDRNAGSPTQNALSILYGLSNVTVPWGSSPADRTGLVGQAVAREQSYGSAQRVHRWVDGRYDYRGISDYAPARQRTVLLSEDESSLLEVPTTADTLVEKPAETFTVIVTSPGLWPSPLGKLTTHVLLEDQSTGWTQDEERFLKETPTTYTTTELEKDIGGMGTTVAMDDACGVLFVSTAMRDALGNLLAGQVLQYLHNDSTHRWSLVRTFLHPSSDGLGFGESLAVACNDKRQWASLVIGQPSQNRAYLYLSQGSTAYGARSFTFLEEISVEEARTSSHRFAEQGAVAVTANLLAIGCPGLEAVYVYSNRFNATAMEWAWHLTEPLLLRSSNYDYDVISGHVHLHRQHFGHAVALSGRDLVVGAPYADYQNLGTPEVQNYNTEGVSIETIAQGAAYVFSSLPTVQEICLRGVQPLQQGSFQLRYEHFGLNATTDILHYNASADQVQAALLALPNCEGVFVKRYEQYVNASSKSSSPHTICWNITFQEDWQDVGTLTPLWLNHSCANCTGFDFVVPAAMVLPLDQQQANLTMPFSTRVLREETDLVEVQKLSAMDLYAGDHFGHSVAIDGHQIVIGAPHSPALTATTWDFESGDLRGWTATGSAFSHQPTWGDNLLYRSPYTPQTVRRNTGVHAYRSKGIGLRGQYYLSSYDLHPRTGEYPRGSVQTTQETGTLLSDVFLIQGPRISFLVAGGCDAYRVYVELRVDGYSVAKLTGYCKETFQSVSFDVSSYLHRAGQLRIVDNSTEAWGFIAVDDITFAWEVDGARTFRPGEGQGENYPQASSHASRTDTLLAGAAYVYERQGPNDFPCTPNFDGLCTWNYQTRLLASDKRSNALFGSQVSVLDQAGIITVSAPGAPLFLSYKDNPTLFPYWLSSRGESSGSGISFPAQPHNMTLFQSAPTGHPLAAGSGGVWRMMSGQKITPPETAKSGAVYVYAKKHAVLGYTGQKAIEGSWGVTETARVQPYDLNEGDAFGTSLVARGGSLSMVVGAPGFSPLSADQGAVYLYKLDFAAVRFEQAVYIVQEGARAVATITLLRDTSIYEGLLVLEYATSDLTAQGVDSAHFATCQAIATAQRPQEGCGDYEHTAGQVVFLPGVVTGGFVVPIMDDYCYERDSKFIQLTLAVPGAGALQGETFHAMIRIDDDDSLSTSQCPTH